MGSVLQVVPHITDAVQEWIKRVASIPVDGKEGPADVCVIELGGTVGNASQLSAFRWLAIVLRRRPIVSEDAHPPLFLFRSSQVPQEHLLVYGLLFPGDIESSHFVEALRQLEFDVGKSSSSSTPRRLYSKKWGR